MLTPDEYARVDWILAKAQAAPEVLTEYEQQFVDVMTERLENRGHNMVVSEPMWRILGEIRDKAV